MIASLQGESLRQIHCGSSLTLTESQHQGGPIATLHLQA